MSAPVRIQRKRTKGWRMPPNTVSVARPGRWGNPAIIGQSFEGEVVENRMHARTIFEDGVKCGLEGFPNVGDIRLHLLGKNLACFCPLDQPCHADVLLELANG